MYQRIYAVMEPHDPARVSSRVGVDDLIATRSHSPALFKLDGNENLHLNKLASIALHLRRENVSDEATAADRSRLLKIAAEYIPPENRSKRSGTCPARLVHALLNQLTDFTFKQSDIKPLLMYKAALAASQSNALVALPDECKHGRIAHAIDAGADGSSFSSSTAVAHAIDAGADVSSSSSSTAVAAMQVNHTTIVPYTESLPRSELPASRPAMLAQLASMSTSDMREQLLEFAELIGKTQKRVKKLFNGNDALLSNAAVSSLKSKMCNMTW